MVGGDISPPARMIGGGVPQPPPVKSATKYKNKDNMVRPSSDIWQLFDIEKIQGCVNKEALQCTVLVENLNVKQNIKKVVLDDAFWQNLQYTKQILHPISKSIYLVESDISISSEVPLVFKYIKDSILDIPQQVDLTSSLIESLLKYVEERYEFCSKPIHFAATLDQLMEAIDFISEMARSLDLDVGKVTSSTFRIDKDYAVLSVHEDEAEIESESDAWSEDSNSDSDENIPLSPLVK
ncbi:unnamed protein product [Acanthoscelides obtectus]|uniref:Uncharacterized protein n=1 Tax=Acanthoscelides obtectus TaxID=200917 RepID=A0A9P0MFM8_ACAOB|nr:unnamed protein product [Acanthoscelides obtectus]CAK1658502.1 hypothetical protein AOBTE_LOCUS20943 [Acanthoscelides obtectus]